MDKRFYITTTIPYVNAPPHMGHALEFIEADVLARWHRAAGEETYFLSGTDDNAIKNVQAAEKAGMPVEEFVDRHSCEFKELLAALNISVDQFIRTTEERHKKGVRALWLATTPGDIYKKPYKGLYCVGCELFYKPEELEENGECPEHPGRKLELVREENYFFRLSKYGPWLRGIIESGELKIIPASRKNEVLAFIDRGLEDFSVSRPVSRSKGWGVPVPADPGQTVYVWYDALANYITALGYPDKNAQLFKKFWLDNLNRMHILGKGVSRFHSIYWPAMLFSAGLPLPTIEFIHGYVTIGGQKMSKTIGEVVNPEEVVRRYGSEAVRYYLLREIPAHGDGDFSLRRFKERYAAELANGLGNFAARVLALGEKCGEMKLSSGISSAVEQKIEAGRSAVKAAMAEFKFNEALGAIWELISFGDSYININKPWETTDQKIIFELVVILDNVAGLLGPFLPKTSEAITRSIQQADGKIKTKKSEILFPRIS
jgi:methionyl-tRNA synthetase